MIGERLSSSGTRLDSCSPLGLAKSSTESLKPKPFKSVSRQSLLDIVSSKLGVSRKTPHQVFSQKKKINNAWNLSFFFKHRFKVFINFVINEDFIY